MLARNPAFNDQLRNLELIQLASDAFGNVFECQAGDHPAVVLGRIGKRNQDHAPLCLVAPLIRQRKVSGVVEEVQRLRWRDLSHAPR